MLRNSGVVHSTYHIDTLIILVFFQKFFTKREKALAWDIKQFDFDSVIKYARNDFLLSGMAGKFPYLKYGISVILFLVGAKMLLSHHFKIPVAASLGVIVGVLAVSILASKIFPQKEA